MEIQLAVELQLQTVQVHKQVVTTAVKCSARTSNIFGHTGAIESTISHSSALDPRAAMSKMRLRDSPCMLVHAP